MTSELYQFGAIWAQIPSIEYDWPETPLGWLIYGGGLLLVITLAIVMYVFEIIAKQKEGWLDWVMVSWLSVLRVGLLITLVWIALNPHTRDTKIAYRPSRVIVLVDTSLSMDFPAEKYAAGSEEERRTRSDAVVELLADSPMIEKLRQRHQVSVYTFDSTLHGRQFQFTEYAISEQAGSDEPEVIEPPSKEQWAETLRAQGLDTRLGEALYALIRAESGRTLSAIVLVSDGNLNAGIDADTVREFAEQNKVRLIAVGVGSTEKQLNLQIANIQAPTEVHIGDPYEISVFVRGQNAGERQVEVELLEKPADDDQAEPIPIETRTVELFEDGVPVEVKFERQPAVAGKVLYLARVKPIAGVRELDDADNADEKEVNIIDRKLRVLIVAGGPMRDYRFVRNMLYRHGAIEMDLWLQTVQASTASKVSQEADKLLTEFPTRREDLFDYDVIVAFDPDWSAVPEEGRQDLVDWVSDHAGGLLLIAGDVHTPELADNDELEPIRELYPVFLRPYLLDLQYDRESDQVWKVSFTREGAEAGFLQVAESQEESTRVWQEFDGIYRTYPTAGAKAGAAVYAHFPDPRTQTEDGQPILMASQFYGSGRTFFLGSAEVWRLRAEGEKFYDRFWTKIIREVSQGRLKRGSARAMLLPERIEYYLGQTVRVRARLLDPQFEPLAAESVPLEVIDPTGRPMIPPLDLQPDPARPGQFVGDFRVTRVGKYLLQLPIPDTEQSVEQALQVRLPDRESQNPEQNAKLLTDLVRDGGGRYLRIDELQQLAAPFENEVQLAAVERSLDDDQLSETDRSRLESEQRTLQQSLNAEKKLRSESESQWQSLFPNRSEEFPLKDRIHTLWDRQLMLYLLVLILSMEWLTRKLLKMA